MNFFSLHPSRLSVQATLQIPCLVAENRYGYMVAGQPILDEFASGRHPLDFAQTVIGSLDHGTGLGRMYIASRTPRHLFSGGVFDKECRSRCELEPRHARFSPIH